MIISLGIKKKLIDIIPQRLLLKIYRRKYRNELQKEEPESNTLIIILDACRFDSFRKAYEGQFRGELKKAYSPAMWTIPSHEAIIRGGIPSPKDSRPEEIFVNNYNINIPMSFQHQRSFGFMSMAFLSRNFPVDNKLGLFFDRYKSYMRAADAEEILDEAIKESHKQDNFFGIVNLHETHFPYGMNLESLEKLQNLIEKDLMTYGELKEQQETQAREVIKVIEERLQEIPKNTQIIITGDHGELFGEEGALGHNPNKFAISHPKVFEVPLITWRK